LPQQVWRLMLKALVRQPDVRVLALDPIAMSSQNCRDGTGRGRRSRPKQRPQLARPPVRVTLVQVDHLRFDLLTRAPRTIAWPARQILQPSLAVLLVAAQPLVCGLGADIETPAKLPHIAARLQGKLNELHSAGHK